MPTNNGPYVYKVITGVYSHGCKPLYIIPLTVVNVTSYEPGMRIQARDLALSADVTATRGAAHGEIAAQDLETRGIKCHGLLDWPATWEQQLLSEFFLKPLATCWGFFDGLLLVDDSVNNS